MRIKFLTLGLACFFLLSSTWIQEKTEPNIQEEIEQKTHFRNTYWGMYHFLHNHVNKNLYIHDYEGIKNSLIEKYGKPKEDKTIWLNNLYKNDPDDWGSAISYGHLRYYAEWTTPETNIALGLLGDKYDLSWLSHGREGILGKIFSF